MVAVIIISHMAHGRGPCGPMCLLARADATPCPALACAGCSRIGARPGASALVDPQTEAELAAAGLPGV